MKCGSTAVDFIPVGAIQPRVRAFRSFEVINRHPGTAADYTGLTGGTASVRSHSKALWLVVF